MSLFSDSSNSPSRLSYSNRYNRRARPRLSSARRSTRWASQNNRFVVHWSQMFWSKRRSSRPDLYNTTNKNQIQQELPSSSRPLFSVNSSPRQPFAILDPLDPQASQSSLAAAADDMSLSPNPPSSDLNSAALKQAISRQIVNRSVTDPKSTQSTAPGHPSRHPQPDQTRRSSIPSLNPLANGSPMSTSTDTADPLAGDLYTHNALNSFSFGSVQIQPSFSSSRSINPLSTSASDDADDRSEEYVLPTDVTPRPSVVAYHHQNQNLVRSHPTQPPGQPGWPPPLPASPTSPGGRPRAGVGRDRPRAHGRRDSDTPSHHTFGASSTSASASATSLSDTSAGLSRTDSRASRHTDTTNQTSAHDLSSTDDEGDHHHPIPAHVVNDLSHTTLGTSAESSGTATAVEFSSDEEYDDSEYDYYEYYDENGINIEISSAQYEGSIITQDWEHQLYSYSGGNSGSIRGHGGSERRGSLPMAIPGATPPSDMAHKSFFPTGRDREGSLATLRRPSRSLDDEFRSLGFNGGRVGDPSNNNVINEETLNRPLPPAPTSVPGSDGDWRSLHERTVMKGKGREQIPPTSTGGTSATRYQPVRAPPIPSVVGGSAMEGFDLDWSDLRGGITTLDHSAVADIIRPNNQASGSNDRRPSAIGSSWLPKWGNNNGRRPSTATVSSYYGDSFGKAIGKWGGDGYRAQKRDWSFRREKADRGGGGIPGGGDPLVRRPSTTGFLSPRGSMVTERSGVVSPSLIERESEREGEREKEKEKEGPKDVDKAVAVKSVVWKGMAINSQEVWKNDLVGRFKVDRRSTKPADPSKGPQQRLVVNHFRDPYASVDIPHNGPPVTIHKHSKAIAFSINRQYKPRMPATAYSRDGTIINGSVHGSRSNFRTTTSSRTRHVRSESNTATPGSVTQPSTTKKTSSMVLLAPRRVQEAFTSTTTTRKLEAHGFLDEKGSGGDTESRDRERAKRREREKEKERQKERERERQREKEREREKRKKEKGKGKQSKDDSHLTSSEGSIASGSTLISSTLQPPPSSAPSSSIHTYPPGSTTSLNSSSSTSRNSSHVSRRRRRIRDPLDDSDDDDEMNAQPSRTPHNEAYGTVDASVIEQLRSRQDRSHASDFDSNGGFFHRFIRGRTGAIPHGLSSGQVVTDYEPPWLTMVSRNKQEQQQRVVDNLNTSFKDVGLLPSTHKDKPKHAVSQKQRKIASGNNKNVDIFEDVPPDSLYMLLPLWAGDTDPVSERRGNVEKLDIPNEQRQYLLVYYKEDLPPAEERSRGEGESRKRSKNSPTSSHDSTTKRDDRTSILLSAFHITARLVSYKDLQGSGVRVPDEGLTITGPLDVAYRTMPPSVRDEGLFEFVLGMCHSREAGIEFYPDGLIKMGLCLQTSEPIEMPISEEDEAPDPDVELTPLGRAVLEMAWLGAMALTSFGPGT